MATTEYGHCPEWAFETVLEQTPKEGAERLSGVLRGGWSTGSGDLGA